MRKTLVIAALVATLAALGALAASPRAAAQTNGIIGCANIVDGTGSYDGSTVDFSIFLARPSCWYVTYALHVLDADGHTVVRQRGNGNDILGFITPASGDAVCVYATTHFFGRGLLDRAPNTGCLEIAAGGSPGFAGFD